MTAIKIYLSSNLKYLGEARGITKQVARADYLNIPRKRYQSWEYGIARPNYEALKEICSIYNVTVEALLYSDLKKKKSAVEEY